MLLLKKMYPRLPTVSQHASCRLISFFFDRPYFDLKAKFNQQLDDQKRQVQLIEETIQMTKVTDDILDYDSLCRVLKQQKGDRELP